MERPGRVSLLNARGLVLLSMLLFHTPGARAEVYLSRDEALAEAFPGATVERLTLVLDDAQVEAVQQRARAKLDSKLAVAYVATRGDTLVGAAFFDSRLVRTMRGVFMTVVAPDTTVSRVVLRAFHEPSDYAPSSRWLAQYDRHTLDDELWPRRAIRNITGATLTARAINESVRLTLALYEAVAAPALANRSASR